MAETGASPAGRRRDRGAGARTPVRRRRRANVVCFAYNDERDRKLYVDDERISGAGGGADRGRKTTAGEEL